MKEDKISVMGNMFCGNFDLCVEMEIVTLKEDKEKRAKPNEVTLGISLFNRLDFNLFGMDEILEFQRVLNIIIERAKNIIQ